jgi:hypothetical protein
VIGGRRYQQAVAVLSTLLVVTLAIVVWVMLRGERRLVTPGRQQGMSTVDGTTASPTTSTTPGSHGGSPGSGPSGGSGDHGAAASPGTGPSASSGSGGAGSGGGSGGGGSGGGGSGGSGSNGPIGPGSYQVGTDIAAGGWTTSGPLLSLSVCTYSVNGQPAIRIAVSVLATTIHLTAGDTFVTDGCQDWRFTG